jgi:Kef-type K+ transport system membrane component KefB
VLARILKARALESTHLGTMSLTCAAVGDVTAWCLLALVVGVTQSRLDSAIWTAVLTGAYIAAMFLVVRPLAKRLIKRWEGSETLDQSALAVVLIVLLLSSLATEFIGIHTLFGAFLIGAIIPHDSTVAAVLRRRLHDLVVVLFLPAFFAFSGLRTEINLIQGSQWWLCAAIIVVACLGKFGGSAVAARLTGMSWRDASALGILMNTRGLMELIVLNIGLDLGVISPTLFAMLVLMALVTTFATTPVLDWLVRSPALDREPASAAVGI